jgi:hypothetical protein
MKQRFRGKGGGMSFFAFQDIITGTAGFLIVIAVFLALDINLPKGISTQADAPGSRAKLDSMTKEIAKLKESLAQLQTVTTEDPETLKRLVENLKDAVAALSASEAANAAKSLEQALPGKKVNRELIIEKQKQITSIKEAEKQLAELRKRVAEAASEIVSLEKTMQDAEEALKQAINKENIIKLIPDDSPTDKKPIVIIVDDKTYDIHPMDGSPAIQASSLPELKIKLAATPPTSHFITLYFKPSAAAAFGSLNQQVRAFGYEIGYDLITEETQFEF